MDGGLPLPLVQFAVEYITMNGGGVLYTCTISWNRKLTSKPLIYRDNITKRKRRPLSIGVMANKKKRKQINTLELVSFASFINIGHRWLCLMIPTGLVAFFVCSGISPETLRMHLVSCASPASDGVKPPRISRVINTKYGDCRLPDRLTLLNLIKRNNTVICATAANVFRCDCSFVCVCVCVVCAPRINWTMLIIGKYRSLLGIQQENDVWALRALIHTSVLVNLSFAIARLLFVPVQHVVQCSMLVSLCSNDGRMGLL